MDTSDGERENSVGKRCIAGRALEASKIDGCKSTSAPERLWPNRKYYILTTLIGLGLVGSFVFLGEAAAFLFAACVLILVAFIVLRNGVVYLPPGKYAFIREESPLGYWIITGTLIFMVVFLFLAAAEKYQQF